jgi:hypothetical protein
MCCVWFDLKAYLVGLVSQDYNNGSSLGLKGSIYDMCQHWTIIQWEQEFVSSVAHTAGTPSRQDNCSGRARNVQVFSPYTSLHSDEKDAAASFSSECLRIL